jgi:hypothetical protein
MTFLDQIKLSWELFKDWLAETFTLAPTNNYEYTK